MSQFKVGDIVIDLRGKNRGTVTSVSGGYIHGGVSQPIEVEFSDGTRSYTIEGRYYNDPSQADIRHLTPLEELL